MATLKFTHRDTEAEFEFDLDKINEPIAGQIEAGVLIPTTKKAVKELADAGINVPVDEEPDADSDEEPDADSDEEPDADSDEEPDADEGGEATE